MTVDLHPSSTVAKLMSVVGARLVLFGVPVSIVNPILSLQEREIGIREERNKEI